MTGETDKREAREDEEEDVPARSAGRPPTASPGPAPAATGEPEAPHPPPAEPTEETGRQQRRGRSSH